MAVASARLALRNARVLSSTTACAVGNPHRTLTPSFSKRSWVTPADLSSHSLREELERRSQDTSGKRSELEERLNTVVRERGGYDHGITIDRALASRKRNMEQKCLQLPADQHFKCSLHVEKRIRERLDIAKWSNNPILKMPKDSTRAVDFEGSYADVTQTRASFARDAAMLSSQEVMYTVPISLAGKLAKDGYQGIPSDTGATLKLLSVSTRSSIYLLAVSAADEHSREEACLSVEKFLNKHSPLSHSRTKNKRKAFSFGNASSESEEEHHCITLYVEPQYRSLFHYFCSTNGSMEHIGSETGATMFNGPEELDWLYKGEVCAMGSFEQISAARSMLSEIIGELKASETVLVHRTSMRKHVSKKMQKTIAQQSGLSGIYVSTDAQFLRVHMIGTEESRENAAAFIDSIGYRTQVQTDGADVPQHHRTRDEFRDMDFTKFGIGGLSDELKSIIRRTFESRLISNKLRSDLGMTHVKGVLLYGEPGTGKTLLARHLSGILGVADPVVVNGPEVESKWVGEAEKNIRALFEAAEEDFEKSGQNAKLHVIIFDELDSIAKTRGGAHAKSRDGALNQLLCSLDGIKNLDNILVIGLTNRRDTLDSALLRPGRLEVHIEVKMPDEASRKEILRIHTECMSNAGRIGTDIDLDTLANFTDGFSGADIAGFVRSAISFSLAKYERECDVLVDSQCFDLALQEMLATRAGDSDLIKVDPSESYGGLLQA